MLLPDCSHAQQKMIVHLNDGKQVEYNLTDVDHVELLAPSTTQQQDAVPEVGGIVAEPVDLGLSVNWAAHNIGAFASTDDGTRLTADEADSKVALWGDAWRLPTDEEVQELYDRCTWEWLMRDGICGRKITGPSGNSIFIPATGIAVDDNVVVRGSIGIYWIAGTPASSQDAANALAYYFDSANIYRMYYPKTNTFPIRAVKDK